MTLDDWATLIFHCLWDGNGKEDLSPLPGVCLEEWLRLVQKDYDEVDRMLVDHETNGGG